MLIIVPPSWGLNERIQVGQESGVWHTVSARQALWYLSPTLQHHCTCSHNVHHPHPSLLPCPLPPRPAFCSHAPASPQILWTFSIYLESVAILPQLFMVSKTGEAETITSHYLFALGVYRTLYLFNWIWRYHFEGFFDLIAIVAGLVQTVLYCDFFYLYITKGSQRGGPAGREPAPSPAPTLPGAPASSPQPCIPRGKTGQREGQAGVASDISSLGMCPKPSSCPKVPDPKSFSLTPVTDPEFPSPRPQQRSEKGGPPLCSWTSVLTLRDSGPPRFIHSFNQQIYGALSMSLAGARLWGYKLRRKDGQGPPLPLYCSRGRW